MTQHNAIQKHQQDAPVAFSSREEIDALAKRIAVMLPSAKLQKWQESPKYRADAERNLHESLYKAAQLCAFYRLVPGEDVHIIPFGNGYAVDMGIQTWMKAADRYCSLHGISYHLYPTELPADEVKARAGTDSGPNSNETGKSLYTPDDVGAICYLWRSDKTPVYEIFGAEKCMTKGYGVWSAKARFDKLSKEWKPDNIPVGRSKMDVAERRAMKMALKREFSLDSLLAASPAELRDNVQAAELTVRNHERRTALPSTPRKYSDDEDDMYLDRDPAPHAAQTEPDIDDVIDAEYTQTNGTPDDVDFNGVGENPFEDDGPSDVERAIIDSWQTPEDAYAWAVEEGHCKAKAHATNSFRKIVTDQFGGKLTKTNAPDVYLAFLRHQVEKAAETEPETA